jgi:tetratricopeptide (TPR) repeat protein
MRFNRLLLLLTLLPSTGCLSLGNRCEDALLAARQLTLRGIDAGHQQRWPEASALLAKAIEQDPGDARARHHYAKALWHQQEHQKAIEQMAEAVRFSAGDPLLSIELGRMHLETGNLAAAEQQAREALEIELRLPEAQALLGDVFAARQAWDQALAHYHRALADRSRYPDVQLAVAEIYQAKGRPRRALATLNTLCDQELPGQIPPRVHYLRGLSLKALRRYEDATECFAGLLKDHPDHVDTMYQLAQCQMLAGRWSVARTVAEEGLARDPQLVGCRQLMQELASLSPRMAAADDMP